ncbi:MAG: GtrA family protein [Ancalomicrobiaceae bacterium]|nr:GtrA family protein [Ancalomicrobiaceae bacterium]
MLKSLAPQFVRYVGVGFAAAAAHYGVLFALVQSGLTGAVAGALAGFVVGGIVSYSLNRRFTFRSDRGHDEAVPRFILITVIAFGLTGALMWLFAEHFGIHYMLAQVITTVIVLFWTFAGNRFWTFTERR